MTQDDTYQRFLEELDSLQLFQFAERSQASRGNFSRGTGWMKATDRQTGELLKKMGRLVSMRRELLDVSLAIVRAINPHSSDAEWHAKLFSAAAEALSHEYDDVERRSGPESFRYSECKRPYSREEKLIVIETLRSFSRDYIGMGWCAKQLADELGCTHTILILTGEKS